MTCVRLLAGAQDEFRADYIEDTWKTQIDTTWPRAHGIGDWPTAQPWLNRTSNRDTYITNDNAEWIWTSNPGQDGSGNDGYRNVFCNVQLPLECGGRKYGNRVINCEHMHYVMHHTNGASVFSFAKNQYRYAYKFFCCVPEPYGSVNNSVPPFRLVSDVSVSGWFHPRCCWQH